jgi:polyvinyl alcohol dehydrogenase (cytochrome)
MSAIRPLWNRVRAFGGTRRGRAGSLILRERFWGPAVTRHPLARLSAGAVALAMLVALRPADAASTAPPQGAWPELGHDGESSFHNPGAGITATAARHLSLAWTWHAPGSVSGTAAIVGGRVYVVTEGGTAALDDHTGRVQWLDPGVSGTSSPAEDDGTVYVLDGATVLHALDAATGHEHWAVRLDTQPYAGGFSSPVVIGPLVIVGIASVAEVASSSAVTFRGSVVAVDRSTGAVAWRHYTVDPPSDGVGVWSSVSVDAGTSTVFVSTGNNYTVEGPTSDAILALDVQTGAPRWIRQVSGGDVFTITHPESGDSDFGTNPILFDASVHGTRRHLLAAGQKSGAFWVLDRETGEILWRRTVSGGSALIGGVFNNGAYDGRRLILAGNNGGPGAAARTPGAPAPGGPHSTALTALDPATGRVLWRHELGGWVWAPITIAHGVGFVAVDTDMVAFDVATGRVVARYPTTGTISSGAALADGLAVFGSGLSYFGTRPGRTVYALK